MERFFVIKAGMTYAGQRPIELIELVPAGSSQEGLPMTEAFRAAKRMAGWRREIPEDERAL